MENKAQILKSWAITLIISPIFFIFIFFADAGFHRTDAENIFVFYFLFVLIGAFFAIPCLVFLMLISHFLSNHRL